MRHRPYQDWDCSRIGSIDSTMTPHLEQGLVHSNHQRYDRHVSQGTGQVTEEVRPASNKGGRHCWHCDEKIMCTTHADAPAARHINPSGTTLLPCISIIDPSGTTLLPCMSTPLGPFWVLGNGLTGLMTPCSQCTSPATDDLAILQGINKSRR